MLFHVQEALARLATDVRQRRRWADDPSGFAEEMSLSEGDLAALRAVPRAALERYAASLVSKRWVEVSRVIPATLRIAPSVERRYRAWALRTPARAVDTVLSPGAAEASRALPQVAAALETDPGEAPYAADVFRYEVLFACSRTDGQVRLLRSAFRVDRLVDAIASGLLPVDPDREPTEVRFEKQRVRWRSLR